jgi:hypothetical protein
MGLADEDLKAVEQATTEGVSLDDLDLSGLTPWQQALTYALAHWLAKVDGIVSTGELATLRKLGARLTLPELKLRAAESAVTDVVCLQEGNRPGKFAFDALVERLAVKLPSLVDE